MIIVEEFKQYLIIEITKIEFQEVLSSYGEPKVRASVQWGGEVQNSCWIKQSKCKI